MDVDNITSFEILETSDTDLTIRLNTGQELVFSKRFFIAAMTGGMTPVQTANKILELAKDFICQKPPLLNRPHPLSEDISQLKGVAAIVKDHTGTKKVFLDSKTPNRSEYSDKDVEEDVNSFYMSVHHALLPPKTSPTIH